MDASVLTPLRDAFAGGSSAAWLVGAGVVLVWLAIRAARMVVRLALGAVAATLIASGAVPWAASGAPWASPDTSPPATSPTDVAPPASGTWTATVDRVVDGDTVRLRVADPRTTTLAAGTRVRARLLRIDTPELGTDDRAPQCLARAATDHLAGLLPPGTTVTAAWDQQRRDTYGRELVHVWTPTGTWVNGAMVQAGYATVVTVPPNLAHDQQVRALERAAREDGRGRWSAC